MLDKSLIFDDHTEVNKTIFGLKKIVFEHRENTTHRRSLINILIFYYHTKVHKTKFHIKNMLAEQRENRPQKIWSGCGYIFHRMFTSKNCSNRWMIVCRDKNKYPQDRPNNLLVSWQYACYDETGIIPDHWRECNQLSGE